MSLTPSLAYLRRLRDDPILFMRKVFNAEPTPQQTQILLALKEPGAKVSVASGHGIGKTGLEAAAIFWQVGTSTNCRVPCTAPSKTQLHDVLWAELHKWHRRMDPAWQKNFRLTKDHVMLVGHDKTSFAVARTSRRENPEALQGFHTREWDDGSGKASLLFILEEATGVADEVFHVAEGALSTPEARVLMMSNPTRTQGFFYNSHHRDASLWKTFSMSSTDSPLVDQAWCERMAKKYGVGSAIYQVRVLGKFPLVGSDQFLSLGLLEDATLVELPPSTPVIWGVDPAYFGDNSSALAKRYGPVVKTIKSVQNMDTMQVAGWIINEYRETPDYERPEAIYIDTTGMGVGVCDRLREKRLPAFGVNFSMRPSNREQFGNLRTELWSLVKERMEARVLQIPDDERLLGEGSAAKYTFDSSGRLILESKKDARNRGVDSPDHFDALSLTFFNEPLFMNPTGSYGREYDTAITEYDPFNLDDRPGYGTYIQTEW